MTNSSIQFSLPTSLSFTGMKRVLFQPFDLGKWFVLGFTAQLKLDVRHNEDDI